MYEFNCRICLQLILFNLRMSLDEMWSVLQEAQYDTSFINRLEYIRSIFIIRSSIPGMTSSRTSVSTTAHRISDSKSYDGTDFIRDSLPTK